MIGLSRYNLIISLLIISFGYSNNTNAQLNDFLFRHFKGKKAVTYGLNNRRTTLLYEPSTIYAGYIGIKFGNQLKHVITLNSTLLWVGEPKNDLAFSPTEVQLNFIGFSEEYVFLKHKKWAFSSYIHFGAGKANFRPIEPFSGLDHTQWVFPSEFGIHTAYSLNKWLELRTGGGYRYVMNAGNWPLHGFYYKVGAGINFKSFEIWFDELKTNLRQFNQPKVK